MGHLQRIVYVVGGLLTVIMLIVMITRIIQPFFDVAETMGVGSGPFSTAFGTIKTVTYWFLVPTFGLSLIGYLIFGPAQEERQKERRRRQL